MMIAKNYLFTLTLITTLERIKNKGEFSAMFNFSVRSFILALSSEVSPNREMKQFPQSSLYTGHIFKLLAALSF